MEKDSENRTGLKADKENGAYAFRQRIGSKEIHMIIDSLLDIVTNPKSANKDKVSASDKLLKYSVAVPRQEIDITSDGDRITGYTFEVIRSNEKED
jgi:hypothetical protein